MAGRLPAPLEAASSPSALLRTQAAVQAVQHALLTNRQTRGPAAACGRYRRYSEVEHRWAARCPKGSPHQAAAACLQQPGVCVCVSRRALCVST